MKAALRYELDALCRDTFRQAVDDEAFGDACDALQDAGLPRAAVCILLEQHVSVTTVDAWKSGKYDPPAAVWPVLHALAAETGWAKVEEIRLAWPDLRRRGTGRKKSRRTER